MDFLHRVLDQLEKQHADLKSDLAALSKKVDDLEKFKWRVVGAVTSITFIVQVLWSVTSKYLDYVKP